MNSNQRRLDELKERVDRGMEASRHVSLIDIPYRGSRTGFFVYHPKRNPNIETAYHEAKIAFLSQLTAWYDTCALYSGEQTLSEPVATKQLKKDIAKVVDELDRDKDPYALEALAELLWDVEGAAQNVDGSFDHKSEKVQQHDLDFMSQIKKMAQEIKFEDLGIDIGKSLRPTDIVQHTYTG